MFQSAVTPPRWTEFADDSAPETEEATKALESTEDETFDLVIPEDASTLSDESLIELHAKAVSSFDAVYGDGKSLSTDAVDALTVLTDGIERLATEVAVRASQAAEREAKAAELAKRVNPEAAEEFGKHPADQTDEERMANLAKARAAKAAKAADDSEEESTEPAAEAEAEAADPALEEDEEDKKKVTASASGPREIRINLASVSRPAYRGSRGGSGTEARTMKDVALAAGEGTGVPAGTGLDWDGISRIVDRRLAGFNMAQFDSANRKGRHIRRQYSVAQFTKPFAEGFSILSNDPMHADEVIRRAINEHNLPGGSLVASGGWVAPSPTVYDLVELETRDGIFKIPEVGIERGGINYTPGPNFGSIYSTFTGFNYSEDDDIDGDYNGSGGGSKPVHSIAPPVFEDVRLDLAGLAISAGLLAQRGYPELIARTTRGALVAHDHRLSGLVLSAIVDGSTAVTMPSSQVGSVAPLLDAIELQVEHYRYVNRSSRTASLEAVFPLWLHGALRSDLARRTGVDLISVTDAQIDDWFKARGVAPQFVYNWQDLTGAAGAQTAWPNHVSFLLYSAGTWVRGSSDVITLDTIYDSVLLGTNDYTALFTEEGWLVMKTGHDSRVVTVPLCPSGATNGGVNITCGGTETSQLVNETGDWPEPTAPEAPTGLVATPGNHQVSVAFTAPGFDGGAAITNYKYSTNNGSTYTAVSPASTASPVVITGLTNDQEYSIKLKAVNVVGDGAASAVVKSTPTGS